MSDVSTGTYVRHKLHFMFLLENISAFFFVIIYGSSFNSLYLQMYSRTYENIYLYSLKQLKLNYSYIAQNRRVKLI